MSPYSHTPHTPDPAWARRAREKRERMDLIRSKYDRQALGLICRMHETDFGDAFGLTKVQVGQRAPADYYFYKDNGSKVLAVAHLDTCVDHHERPAHFVQTEGSGEVIFAGGLDDRLGAWVIIDLLPRLGLNYDLLLTVGEESGMSTAKFFQPPEGKEYDWIIEFDRGGSDVVMYQYEDSEVRGMVSDTGARVAHGSFSDIADLEHLGVKAFNWGVGYKEYHTTRGHAFLEDTFEMVAYYLDFHETWEGTAMPHFPDPWRPARRSSMGGWSKPPWWDDDTPTLAGVGTVGSSFAEVHEDAESGVLTEADLDALIESARAAGLSDVEIEEIIEDAIADSEEGAEVVDPPDFIENPTPEQLRDALGLTDEDTGGANPGSVEDYLKAVAKRDERLAAEQAQADGGEVASTEEVDEEKVQEALAMLWHGGSEDQPKQLTSGQPINQEA